MKWLLVTCFRFHRTSERAIEGNHSISLTILTGNAAHEAGTRRRPVVPARECRESALHA